MEESTYKIAIFPRRDSTLSLNADTTRTSSDLASHVSVWIMSRIVRRCLDGRRIRLFAIPDADWPSGNIIRPRERAHRRRIDAFTRILATYAARSPSTRTRIVIRPSLPGGQRRLKSTTLVSRIQKESQSTSYSAFVGSSLHTSCAVVPNATCRCFFAFFDLCSGLNKIIVSAHTRRVLGPEMYQIGLKKNSLLAQNNPASKETATYKTWSKPEIVPFMICNVFENKRRMKHH